MIIDVESRSTDRIGRKGRDQHVVANANVKIEIENFSIRCCLLWKNSMEIRVERAMRGWRRNGERGCDGTSRANEKRCIVVAGERCPFGVCCKFGLIGVCKGVHSQEEKVHFEGKRAGMEREKRAPCAFVKTSPSTRRPYHTVRHQSGALYCGRDVSTAVRSPILPSVYAGTAVAGSAY